MPYLAGPNAELWQPIRKTAANSIGMECRVMARAAKSMMPTSTIFTTSITRCLLKRSASQPPSMENSRNGAANKAAMIET